MNELGATFNEKWCKSRSKDHLLEEYKKYDTCTSKVGCLIVNLINCKFIKLFIVIYNKL